MPSPITLRVRLLLSALPLAGLLFVTGIVGRGPSLDPSADPVAFAAAAVAANAGLAWFAILIGMIVELLGLCALYIVVANGPRERAAFWGLGLSILGIALVLPLIGFMALAAPTVGAHYLAGRPEALDAATAIAASSPGLLLAMVSGVTYIAGAICFAVALRGVLPRALLAAYILQAPLLSVVAIFSFVAELIGAVMLLACGAWIVWRAWRSPAPAILQAPVVSPVHT